MNSEDFHRIRLLPPYVFAEVEDEKARARAAGRDVTDFGLGNPDQPTPAPIVDALIAAAREGRNHRYQPSKGIRPVREAIAGWYRRRFGVEIDPDAQAVATIGSKEGIGHLMLGIVGPGDRVLVPGPSYPVHIYGVLIAGGEPVYYGIGPGRDHLEEIQRALRGVIGARPKGLVICFPHNPTTAVEERPFYEKIVELARAEGLWVIHDLAYADLCFDGHRATSILEIPGAQEIAVEFFTVSKSFNMPGWRLGFCVGNPVLCGALARVKTYLDYGIFAPIQIAGIAALGAPDEVVAQVRETYRERRDALCRGLAQAGWNVPPPKATMFAWARIPERLGMRSMEFSRFLLDQADVAVSPGAGFGPGGDDHVRFGLVESVERTRDATVRIGRALARR
jgi:alanine-synthesizing transaminase